MSDEILIGIAKSIVRHNDPLWTAGYLFSLNPYGDIYFQMILDSEYASKNILEAAYLFSKKCLENYGVDLENLDNEHFEEVVSVKISDGVRKR